MRPQTVTRRRLIAADNALFLAIPVFSNIHYGWMLLVLFAATAGCALSGYETDSFEVANVHVVHSRQHCSDGAYSVPDAELLDTLDLGIGRLVATDRAWEVMARQVAVELGGDLAVVSPCDGEPRTFEFAQLTVWRTPNFKPTTQEEALPQSGTLLAPSQTNSGEGLQNILDCLEESRDETNLLAPDDRERLGGVDATEFFSSDRYFPGYAKIDRYFRPTRTGDKRLSMINSGRAKADQSAMIYGKLSAEEKRHFAERYLVCLLNRGYSW